MLKAGICVGMLKQEVFPVPEAVAHLRAEALVDGALHAALRRGAEGLEELTIAVASNWVGILVLAAAGTGVWSFLRRRKRRKTPPAPPADGE